MLNSTEYVRQLTTIMESVARTQSQLVKDAAGLVLASLQSGGVIHAFGTGHSEGLAMEIAGRAGGLIPTNKLALRDVVLYGGESPEILRDMGLERDTDIAHRVFDLAMIEPSDIFVVASNSGVNGSVVELALLAKKSGHRLIAITSIQHTNMVESKHPSGRRLCDIADVVLDNGAPYGDAILPLPDGGSACAISSITSALLAQMMVAEVVRRFVEAGDTPPVYVSANVPGGDEHNQVLEEKYTDRIRRSA